MQFDAIIVGAGISGLAAAHRLTRLGRNVAVVEGQATAGGVIETITADGFLIERGPNSFRGTHHLIRLIDELELRSELITADPKAPAYIYSEQRLDAVPMSAVAALTTRLLSISGKLRVLAEPFASRREGEPDESIASFVRRRLGEEVLNKLVAPFVSGVYAGDVEQLSVQTTLSRLAQFEARSGSILFGALAGMSGSSRREAQMQRPSIREYRMCSFRDGMQTLVRTLSHQLEARLRTRTTVETIVRSQVGAELDGYELRSVTDGRPETLFARFVIVATPAFHAARLVEQIAPGIVAPLREIRYNTLVSVPIAYHREEVARPLDGFGFLAAPHAGLRVLGSVWNSSLFPGRAPADHILTTNFVGGTRDPEAVELPDSRLIEIVKRDLQTVIGARRARALPITRYHSAIPQYSVGHLEIVSTIRRELSREAGLRLVGNYLDGVSIGHCIERADAVAVEVEERLAERHT